MDISLGFGVPRSEHLETINIRLSYLEDSNTFLAKATSHTPFNYIFYKEGIRQINEGQEAYNIRGDDSHCYPVRKFVIGLVRNNYITQVSTRFQEEDPALIKRLSNITTRHGESIEVLLQDLQFLSSNHQPFS